MIDFDLYIDRKGNLTLKDLALNEDELKILKKNFGDSLELDVPKSKVLLVSIDGFRPDVVEGTETIFEEPSGKGYDKERMKVFKEIWAKFPD